MSGVHKDVILEALSALTGTPLKHHTHVNDMTSAIEVNIFNLISIAVARGGLPLFSIWDQDTPVNVKKDDSTVLKYNDEDSADPPQTDGEDDVEELRKELFVNIEKLLDPKYDCDFTHLGDDSTCMRGNEQYKRPYGWNRLAVKVLDKYPDGNVWLGPNGWRDESMDGEWPVSYHGTSIDGARGIIKTYFKPGEREMYGRGIYSTPDIEVACFFSKQFTSKTNGKTYKVLLQNRINPDMRKKCDVPDFWLVEVPHDTPPDEVKKIAEKSIRPYGILLKERKVKHRQEQ